MSAPTSHHLDDVRDYFGEGTPYLKPGYARRLRSDIVRQLVGPADDRRVLDAGCGDGSISVPVFVPRNDLTLLDLSPAMLERARALVGGHGARVRFVEGDLNAAEVGADFDVVMLIGVLAHVPSIDEALARAAALVKPGGCCVIQLTDHSRPLGRVRWWLERLASSRDAARRYQMNRTTLTQIDRGLARHGLTRRATTRYSWILPGMGRLPDGFLESMERLTARVPLLGAIGTTVIARYDKPA